MLRPPIATVGFIDEYCVLYRSVFEDMRLYECFKWLHVGIVSPLPRQTLPEIAKLKGLKDGQSLHHFLRDAITDNGHGIPEHIRSKIFDPFFTTKAVGKGTGLGLAIRYKIVVEKHGGRLQYHSQPGKGTEIMIEIPVLPPETEFLHYHPAAKKSIERTGHDRARTTCGTVGHYENLVSR